MVPFFFYQEEKKAYKFIENIWKDIYQKGNRDNHWVLGLLDLKFLLYAYLYFISLGNFKTSLNIRTNIY